MLVRQLEEELRLRMRNPSIEMQGQMDALFSENEHLTREVAILRETIRVSNWLENVKLNKSNISPRNWNFG